ncbi:hypothetical protein [Rhodopirellula bahusiensis]|uniref:hypothetical protein n=1 Tax=Rhodopirellula bahusiensis TaxID=2014065 RepID=UPI0032678545
MSTPTFFPNAKENNQMGSIGMLTRSIFLVAVTLVSSVQAQVLSHSPYVDPHFNLDSTPRYGYTETASTGGDTRNAGCTSAEGSHGKNCPRIQNAILQLHLPDGLQVEVNGHATRPQTLAGIHANTRRYSLEGLFTDRVRPTDIVVIEPGDYGVETRYHHSFAAHADETYHVYFPGDFQKLHTTSVSASSGMMLPAEMVRPHVNENPNPAHVLGGTPPGSMYHQPMQFDQPLPYRDSLPDQQEISMSDAADVTGEPIPMSGAAEATGEIISMDGARQVDAEEIPMGTAATAELPAPSAGESIPMDNASDAMEYGFQDE